MTITLYKIGDFYEAIGDETLVHEVATATGRTRTAIRDGSPFRRLGAFTVGIPYHSIDEAMSILRTRGNVVHIEERPA